MNNNPSGVRHFGACEINCNINFNPSSSAKSAISGSYWSSGDTSQFLST